MAEVQLADVIVPAEFTAYQVYPTFCWSAASRNLEAPASDSEHRPRPKLPRLQTACSSSAEPRTHCEYVRSNGASA
jgi:hypothetical protein